MANDITVKITKDKDIPGKEPIVLLGPNGSGKTRHAVSMARMNNANMISALRYIGIPDAVTRMSVDQAQRDLQSKSERVLSQPWEASGDIDRLFAKFMEEDSVAAKKFRNQYIRNQYNNDTSIKPDVTKLMTLSELWNRLFPGRYIDFSDYKPRVKSDYNKTSGEYPARQMSDGERVALYLAARVLDAEKKIIIVDEPEVHLHSRLASRFWNELETLRSDCRFIYATHDLPFALSRKNARYILIKPNEEPEVIRLKEGIPNELAESLLAAASFSIHAKRIVFCEGEEGKSYDGPFVSAWFNSSDTAVIPVGSCKDVVRCTKVFTETPIIMGVESIGIIDQDYWAQVYLDSLPPSITVLAVHEIENLFCKKELYLSIAEHLGIDEEDSKKRYQEFIDKAKSKFKNGLLNKQISERFKKRIEHEMNLSLNKIKPTGDVNDDKANHAEAVSSKNWDKKPEDIYDEEMNKLQDALSDDDELFLKYFPGKVFFEMAVKSLGVEKKRYVNLICSALTANIKEKPLFSLGKKIQSVLESYLPERK